MSYVTQQFAVFLKNSKGMSSVDKDVAEHAYAHKLIQLIDESASRGNKPFNKSEAFKTSETHAFRRINFRVNPDTTFEVTF